MANASISGLASGLDTATIIDQLMQLEAVHQSRLKTQQNTEKAVQAALRTLNTDTSVLASNAEKLAKAETWQTLKATVTGSGVTATANASASPTSFSVTVDKLATTHQIAFADAAALDAAVAGSSITLSGHADPIDVGGGTLSEVAAAINATSSETGVGATLVKVADGQYRLLLESTATGAASAFTVDGITGLGGTQERAGQDAQVSIGSLGITASSATNTFADLTPGVTVTLAANAQEGDTVAIKVAQDPSSVSNAVGALVNQLNSLLSSIDAQTAGKTTTTSAGTLAGDAAARSLRSALVNTVFGEGTTSMAQVGIQTDRYGKLVFDADKFAEAYRADPAGVAAQFTTGADGGADGWAARLDAVAKAASNSTTGTITAAINGRTTTIDRLSQSIEAWDDRLALRRTSLERQYTALETALSRMQSQSTWLAGQIASLPKYSSS